MYGDFHTHTQYSHGKGTVEDNVKQAKEQGLKAIAITDHGLHHIAFGLKRRELEKLKKEISGLQDKYGIKVLMGIEANITGLNGTVDLKHDDYDIFDVVLAGFHKFVFANSFKDIFKFFLRNYFSGDNVSDKVKNRNTKAYIEAIKNNKIDVITHINYGIKVNCKEVAQAAYDYGTFIEINSKRITYSDEEFMQMYNTGVNFIVNSDAHTLERVGEVSLAANLIKRLNVSPERIVNLNGMPHFRSKSWFD